MEEILHLYKEEGETPLECLERFRAERPAYAGVSMTYAGRLDPLACGELLVLAGSKVYEKEHYCGCDKEYVVEALLGAQTDTYDVLGIPRRYQSAGISQQDILDELASFIGKQNQAYPPYSSRTVEGKPLWQWAREGKLDEIKIPSREVEIYDIFDSQMSEVINKEIIERVNEVADLVQGDFRQDDIRSSWAMSLGRDSNESFQIISFHVRCSSGTYIRTLVHELGKKLGTGACVYRLERTKIFTTKENSQP